METEVRAGYNVIDHRFWYETEFPSIDPTEVYEDFRLSGVFKVKGKYYSSLFGGRVTDISEFYSQTKVNYLRWNQAKLNWDTVRAFKGYWCIPSETVWTDGTDYYSSQTRVDSSSDYLQFKLNKTTMSWEALVWQNNEYKTNLDIMAQDIVELDGNIYWTSFSIWQGEYHITAYKKDGDGFYATNEITNWPGLGRSCFKLGNDTYWANGYAIYKYDSENKTWNSVTWIGGDRINVHGGNYDVSSKSCVWVVAGKAYHSYCSTSGNTGDTGPEENSQYEFMPASGGWKPVTWKSWTAPEKKGSFWTYVDGERIYIINGAAYSLDRLSNTVLAHVLL